MLAPALQAEVAAYIDAHGGEVAGNGYRLVIRNGFHQPREVVTAAGCGAGAGAAGQRQAIRRRDRGTSPVLLGDPAGVGAQVSPGGRGVAAAVLAWLVQQ